MVRAGEATGRLDQALRAVIKLVEWNDGFGDQVRRPPPIRSSSWVSWASSSCWFSLFSLPAILKLLEELKCLCPW